MTSAGIQILIAALTVLGTSISAIVGILIANNMANYRIKQLEAKVEVHNSAMTRIVILEQNTAAMWRKVDPYDGAVNRLNVLEAECLSTKERVKKIEDKIP